MCKIFSSCTKLNKGTKHGLCKKTRTWLKFNVKLFIQVFHNENTTSHCFLLAWLKVVKINNSVKEFEILRNITQYFIIHFPIFLVHAEVVCRFV